MTLFFIRFKKVIFRRVQELNQIYVNDIKSPLGLINNNNFLRNQLFDFNKCKI